MPNNIDPSDTRFVKQICTNTQSDLIEITEDKLEIIFIKFLSKYTKSKYWVTSLTVVLTILIAILTADFNKDFLSISKDIWSAIFYLGLFLSFILFIYSMYFAIKHRNDIKIEKLLKTIKNN